MRLRLQKNRNCLLYFLWIGAVLVNLKSIFTDFGIDNGYAIATSYRHISGDHMFLEMWEPHQTSAFLVDILMIIYRIFVPSLTGVAIYLQVMGVLLWIPIIIILYRELSKHIDTVIAHMICILLCVFRAKQTVFPEFSNMQIGFSVLFFVFLIKYIFDQRRIRYLILSAVFMCLEILSYPTCIIVFFAAAVLLLLYTERRWRNVLAFSGVCLVLGSLYVGYFIWARGFSELCNTLWLLIKADASHTGGDTMPLFDYLHVFAEGVVYIAGILSIAAVICICFRKYRNIPFLAVFGGIMLATAGAILLFLMIRKQNAFEWQYCIVLVLLIAIGIRGYGYLTVTEKKIWISGTLISFSSFFAVAILTNCALMSVVAYLPLAAAVSMIVLPKFRKGTFFAGTVLLFIMLHRGLIVWGYSQLSYRTYVSDAESIIRTGPALGIICDDYTSCVYRDNVVDFERYIRPDDSVLLLKDNGFDPLVYVQAGVEVSISSTISSPTFDTYQIEYWNRYRYKMPTVVAVECYGGENLTFGYSHQTFFEWVEEHYDFVGDGTWWKFYRIKE